MSALDRATLHGGRRARLDLKRAAFETGQHGNQALRLIERNSARRRARRDLKASCVRDGPTRQSSSALGRSSNSARRRARLDLKRAAFSPPRKADCAQPNTSRARVRALTSRSAARRRARRTALNRHSRLSCTRVRASTSRSAARRLSTADCVIYRRKRSTGARAQVASISRELHLAASVALERRARALAGERRARQPVHELVASPDVIDSWLT